MVSLQGRRILHLTWLHSCPIGEFHLTSYRLLPQPALGPDATRTAGRRCRGVPVVSILNRLLGRMQPRWSRPRWWSRRSFNPQPALGPDATQVVPPKVVVSAKFQSSTGSWAGCNPGGPAQGGGLGEVSILNRLLGRMQHEPARPARPRRLLSSARTEEAAFHCRHRGNPILGESGTGHPSIRGGCAIGGRESG